MLHVVKDKEKDKKKQRKGQWQKTMEKKEKRQRETQKSAISGKATSSAPCHCRLLLRCIHSIIRSYLREEGQSDQTKKKCDFDVWLEGGQNSSLHSFIAKSKLFFFGLPKFFTSSLLIIYICSNHRLGRFYVIFFYQLHLINLWGQLSGSFPPLLSFGYLFFLSEDF